ncbi:MAG: hypothetical protein JW730_07145 [Anaerolineales bacterium]|nr:hypothetical protein [Anaerolineales bacterium]
MDEKLNSRPLADVSSHQIALWLSQMGFTRKRWSLRFLLAVFPDLLETALCLEEIYRTSNMVLWILEPEDEGTSNDVLMMVDEMIERAPTPFGNDNFVIIVERRLSLPGDGDGSELLQQEVESTLAHRALADSMVLRGNRWKDWKHGDSKQRLLEMLDKAFPSVEASVTLIRAAVLGRSFARLAARLS